MLFNSQAYLFFFLAVFILYWAVPWARGRVYLLVAASIYFYAAWSQLLALLVVSTTVMDYLLARGMDTWRSPRLRRLLLVTSLAVNLGLLCYFKYANFFLDSLREALQSIGAQATIPALQVIIPFGISFYTFEAISYTLDVYHRRIKAERDLSSFLLFILFFPHLVAGPIVRGRDFLPQTHSPKRFNWLRLLVGVQFILTGLFKKMLADRFAEHSDPIFQNPAVYGSNAVWLAVLAFAARIYCDFSGYSDLALGSAHLLGYKLNRNFAAPYLSANIAEFWRRWHISLSSWLRDYVFIPLGGSRGGTLATCRNLMITMTLGGLWHGAAWSYVLWGGLHGLLLVIHRLFRATCDQSPTAVAWRDTYLARCVGTALTFSCVTLSWVFFQPSLAVAGILLQRLFAHVPGISAGHRDTLFGVLLGLAVLVHLAGTWRAPGQVLRRLPVPVLGVALAFLFALAILLLPDHSQVFFYFQF
jgi:alginate O-acetyltransferase complex protein AlgI